MLLLKDLKHVFLFTYISSFTIMMRVNIFIYIFSLKMVSFFFLILQVCTTVLLIRYDENVKFLEYLLLLELRLSNWNIFNTTLVYGHFCSIYWWFFLTLGKSIKSREKWTFLKYHYWSIERPKVGNFWTNTTRKSTFRKREKKK